MSLYSKLKTALIGTSQKISQGIENIFIKKRLDEGTLEELEELLIFSDVGVKLSQQIINSLRKNKFHKEITPEEIKAELASIIESALTTDSSQIELKSGLNVILLCGVNGSGKTTTIGKLAKLYQDQGKKIAIAACDTFRAAAVDQIEIWAQRNNSLFYKGNPGSDPASVAYQAIESCQASDVDILFIDTAGRLHNNSNLMQELAKINRVIKKVDNNFPQYSLIVLDGTTGQNALIQVEEFNKIVELNGIICTKLDGTSKAGALAAIVQERKLPVYFIGVGEGAEDLKKFSPKDFAKALVNL